jgi:hypothetical protein
MGFQIMEQGTPIPQRNTAPKAWTRRAIASELKRSPDTIYKWELEMHGELLQLTHSFKVWEFLIKQSNAPKKRHPPLDSYQVECLLLLGELRKNAPANMTIAQTVRDNGLMFYELHQMYSHYKPNDKNA